jgi:hypothetical protein
MCQKIMFELPSRHEDYVERLLDLWGTLFVHPSGSL